MRAVITAITAGLLINIFVYTALIKKEQTVRELRIAIIRSDSLQNNWNAAVMDSIRSFSDNNVVVRARLNSLARKVHNK